MPQAGWVGDSSPLGGPRRFRGATFALHKRLLKTILFVDFINYVVTSLLIQTVILEETGSVDWVRKFDKTVKVWFSGIIIGIFSISELATDKISKIKKVVGAAAQFAVDDRLVAAANCLLHGEAIGARRARHTRVKTAEKPRLL